MSQPMRTTLTLLGLGVLLMFAAVWGWNAATKPLPAKVDSAICVDTSVAAGELSTVSTAVPELTGHPATALRDVLRR